MLAVLSVSHPPTLTNHYALCQNCNFEIITSEDMLFNPLPHFLLCECCGSAIWIAGVLSIIALKKSFDWDLLDSLTQSQWEYFSHLYAWYLLQQGTKISVFSSQLRSSVEHLSVLLAPENILLWLPVGYSCFIFHGTTSMMLIMAFKSLSCNIYFLLH